MGFSCRFILVSSSCNPVCAPACIPVCTHRFAHRVYSCHCGAYFCYFHLNILKKLSTWGCAYRILLCMPSIKSLSRKFLLTGTILWLWLPPVPLACNSAGGFIALGSYTAATAVTGAEPTQSAQESPQRKSSLPEPTPEPTTPAQKMERIAQNALLQEGARQPVRLAPFSTSADAADMLVQHQGWRSCTPQVRSGRGGPGVYEHWWW